jgi:hypothetical protein
MVPFSCLSPQGDKIDLTIGDNFDYEFANNNLRNHLKTNPESGYKSTKIITKKQKEPSILVQNTFSSSGLTEEDSVKDTDITGNRDYVSRPYHRKK